MGWLSKLEKFQLKQAIEGLVEQYGFKRNEILDHYDLDRIAYYHQVDPVTEDDTKEKPVTKRQYATREHGRVAHLSPSEKLTLYYKVEELRLEGWLIPTACEEVGIHTKHYYEWDANVR